MYPPPPPVDDGNGTHVWGYEQLLQAWLTHNRRDLFQPLSCCAYEEVCYRIDPAPFTYFVKTSRLISNNNRFTSNYPLATFGAGASAVATPFVSSSLDLGCEAQPYVEKTNPNKSSITNPQNVVEDFTENEYHDLVIGNIFYDCPDLAVIKNGS
jgi:hypothetical protein